MRERRFVAYSENNDNGREQLLVAVELPKLLRFLSWTKFGKYERWERIGWSWYERTTGDRAHYLLQEVLEIMRDECRIDLENIDET